MGANVACVQMQPVLCDRDKNLAKMEGFIKECKNRFPKTELVVFPELITSGYEGESDFQRLAEIPGEGESFKFLSSLAKSYKINLVFGFPERDRFCADLLFNSAALITPEGKTAGVYRKVHLFDTEKRYFRSGCSYPVFETSVGKLGIMICWDTAFPEVARTYALRGADLIVVSTNWEKPYEEDWDLITKARAFDNCMHLIAANRIGFDKTLGFFGRSKIIDPLGRELQGINEEKEGIIAADLDLSLAIKKRIEYYTFFKDRRPDTYEELVRKY